jgi:hypothetical protein
MNLLIQFLLNLASKFSSMIIFNIIALMFLLISTPSFATVPIDYEPPIHYSNWDAFDKSISREFKVDQFRGSSEIWTGGLALLSGLVGDAMTKDPLEKGVYSIFQSIGIASIGLGLYDMQIGSQDRKFHELLTSTNDAISIEDKTQLVRKYSWVEKKYDKKDKSIKIVTFSLIAITQLYNSTRVTNASVKNTMMFLGAVNSLVALSFSF